MFFCTVATTASAPGRFQSRGSIDQPSGCRSWVAASDSMTGDQNPPGARK